MIRLTTNYEMTEIYACPAKEDTVLLARVTYVIGTEEDGSFGPVAAGLWVEGVLLVSIEPNDWQPGGIPPLALMEAWASLVGVEWEPGDEMADSGYFVPSRDESIARREFEEGTLADVWSQE